jgi:hypothetical protein
LPNDFLQNSSRAKSFPTDSGNTSHETCSFNFYFVFRDIADILSNLDEAHSAMTMLSFDAIAQTDGKPYRLSLESGSIASVEEGPNDAAHGGTCILRGKIGDTYLVKGDFADISERISPKETGLDKFKSFLNSGLGIFCLTTIFVTFGGAALKWSIDKHSEHVKKIEHERSLLIEFDSRVSQIAARETQINEFKTDAEKGSATLCIYHLAAGTGVCDSTGTAKGRPLAGIVNELTGLGVQADSKLALTTLGDIEAQNGEVLNSANMPVYPPGLLRQKLDTLRTYSREAWKHVAGG